MSDNEIETHRQHKMATLLEAREHYRRCAACSSRPLVSSPSRSQLRSLQMAVRVADADLRLFNRKHPRPQGLRAVSGRSC